MAIGGLLTWMADWWASPLDAMNQDRFGIANFSVHGIAPIGYAAFAFALGVTAGALLRRTVPAMAVTVAAFAVARVAVTYWVRPNLASPVRESLPLSAASGPGFLYGSSQGTMNFNAYIQSGVPTPGVGQVVLTAPQVNVPNGWVYSTSAVDKAGRARNEPLPVPGLSRAQTVLEATVVVNSTARGVHHKDLIDAAYRRHLPTGKPVLAVPVGRDGDLPRGCAGAVRAHVLVAASPVRVSSDEKDG